MTEIIHTCAGMGCEIACHCDRYRYMANAPGRIVIQDMPTHPGEACPDYVARGTRWGYHGDQDGEAE
jgi:hypothetical protein